MAGDGGGGADGEDITSDEGEGGGGGGEGGGGRSSRSSGSARSMRFPLPEACLLVGLNVVEEAVLEDGGGEAAAGLLRAFRTVRNYSSEGGDGGGGKGGGGFEDQALGGRGRGHVKGGELYRFVELLEQVQAVQYTEHGWGGGNRARGECTHDRGRGRGGRGVAYRQSFTVL